ncbi:MAG: T9SS type A sorting domain-containing protein [Flavobacteriales bacterium]|nr:T9SS type A sorting domain-containing protein [Flavobacteriales bacterium]
MKRSVTLLLAVFVFVVVRAGSGGPDQYGYLWKDSNEPGGPTYDWIDITSIGTLMTGLADDNLVGPYVMQGNMPYYWYSVKNVWISSNGYVAFNPGNMAAMFPTLPAAGATNDYMAVFMADLTFLGAGNPAQVYAWDDQETAVFSWINVPYWSVSSPGYSGSNTFQVVFNKLDSTITMQYQSNSGINGSNGPVCGIESITGDIGLARSQLLSPAANYAVRFYNPAEPLLDVTDASVEWVGQAGTGGTNISVGASIPLLARIKNTGNQTITSATITGTVLSPFGAPVYTETVPMDALLPSQVFDPPFLQSFTPTLPGTYQQRIIITGIANEFIASNNILSREVGVYDPAQLSNVVDWAGTTDNLVGIGWNGGDGGVATYIAPPSYPCQITGTTIRIASNIGTAFTMKVYDDDGLDGAHGTLLDSAYIQGNDALPGDHVYPLANPIQVSSGGYYVEWYMQGTFVNIAVDVQPPFSQRTFEVLGNVWANYRDRSTQDFHLGLRIEPAPFTDVGCEGLIGIGAGQFISASTPVTALLKNYGNTPATGFPVNYSFNGGPATTQSYSGPAIQPGNSALMNFTQPLLPSVTANGQFCTWTSAIDDAHPNNDSVCVNIDLVAGIKESAIVQLIMAPNPANDAITVNGIPAGNMHWNITDPSGKTVLFGAETLSSSTWKVNVAQLANGPYLLNVRVQNGKLQGRFVVQR